MGKPECWTVTQLAKITSASRKAIYKKIERARSAGLGFIEIKGHGYYTFSKPGKAWLCYKVRNEGIERADVEKELKRNINDLFTVIDGNVCDVCKGVMVDIKAAIMQED